MTCCCAGKSVVTHDTKLLVLYQTNQWTGLVLIYPFKDSVFQINFTSSPLLPLKGAVSVTSIRLTVFNEV